MKSNKEPSPIAVVWEWAGAYHAKFYAAVLLAVLGWQEPCCPILVLRRLSAYC